MIEELKLIRQELFEAYEMENKILIGYAINRLDTLLYEQYQKDKQQQEQTPAFSNVISSADTSDIDSDEGWIYCPNCGRVKDQG